MNLYYDWGEKIILIVEDDDPGYQYFESLLRKTGVKISRFRNGVEILDFFEQGDGKADLILMDILIPLKNGIEATAAIKKIRKEIPIVVVTAYASPDIQKKSFMAGCDAYLTKPVLPHKLLQTITPFIEQGVNATNL
ncbi:MAG: response regulator [Chlorobi bacterium]|nr:response regulator [Chlorobiota bacterium]